MKTKPHPRGTHREQPVYIACYTDHPVARYNNNPLIRALTPLPSHLELQARLTKLPAYGEGERELDRSLKVMRLQELFRFYVGLPRVVELMEMLHTMICEGYMGREPFSPEDHARRQALYERQQRGELFDIEDVENGAEFTAALIGIPGIGKSQAIKRASKPYRRVIYHPELHIYQIPALLIEMPYKGVSVNTLAHSIIRALDKAFPQGKYYETYLAGRENAEVLFMDAVQLMQAHYVGILLVDESQNKDYRSRGDDRKPSKAVKGQTPLTTLLITATNESQIPMLMSGTPELRDILAARMSMLRRIVGRGMRVWKPLTLPKKNKAGEVVNMGEFDVVLQLLWDYQWTKTPFELTPRLRNIFYYYTQGISDIVVKLFHDIQLRAIRDGGEEIVDEDLVHDVANEELAALTELTGDMRNMNYDRTGRSADLAAYLRIDPHEMNFDRQEAQSGLVVAPEEDPEDGFDDDDFEAPADAAQEPVEVPTGPKARRPRQRRAKTGDESAPSAPAIEPVDDLGNALDD